jgi:Tfp pilus assembly protein PilX
MKRILGRKTGFAHVAALMAIWILTAIGILVFTVSTQDLRISTRLVGEKMAFAALETGVHALTRDFDYENLSASKKENQLADAGGDPNSRYTVGEPWIPRPTEGPAFIYYTGFSAESSNAWGRARYLADVTGFNTRYSSTMQVNTGIGYGPIPVSPESR